MAIISQLRQHAYTKGTVIIACVPESESVIIKTPEDDVEVPVITIFSIRSIFTRCSNKCSYWKGEIYIRCSNKCSYWGRRICIRCTNKCWLPVLSWLLFYDRISKYWILIKTSSSWSFIIADVTTDILTALEFFNDGHWWWFSLTVIFAVFPNYYLNHKCRKDMLKRVKGYRKILVYILFVMNILWIVWFPWKAWRIWKKENRKSLNKDTSEMEDNPNELVEMKAWESYLESTPELGLQSRVIVQLIISCPEQISALKITSLVLSLCSVSYSLAKWCEVETKIFTSWKLHIGRILTYFFVLGSRMYICGAAATIHPILWWAAPLLSLMSYTTAFPLRRHIPNWIPACCKLPMHLQDSDVKPLYVVFICGLRTTMVNGTSGSALYPSFSFFIVSAILFAVYNADPLFITAVIAALIGVLVNLIMIALDHNSPPRRRYGELLNWEPTSS